MAFAECITLVPYLKAVPDTRRAQGKQYELWVLLTILSVALLSGQKTVWGIVQWAVLHAGELIAHLELPKKRLPSCSTFYVTLRKIGIEGLEAVSYTHLRAHETRHDLVCRLLLEKKKNK